MRNLAILAFMLLGPFSVYLLTPPKNPHAAGKLDDTAKVERIERMYSSYDDLTGVRTVSATELLERSDPFVLVDVRAPEEQQVSRIPGAMAHADFERVRDDYKGQTIVTYCTIGYRSGLFAKDLATEGYEVLNLRGGVLSWTHAGGPLSDANGDTKRVHVYGTQWNLAAEGYEATW